LWGENSLKKILHLREREEGGESKTGNSIYGSVGLQKKEGSLGGGDKSEKKSRKKAGRIEGERYVHLREEEVLRSDLLLY